ncbi:MAG: diacylglycerol kinase family protein [Henriciella sp.]
MTKILALINPLSGSVPPEAEEKLAAALEELGETCDTKILEGDGFTDLIDEAIAASPDYLIIWSGDGTVACALERAGPDGPPIVALPGGTMNLFHKQIHGGACEWQECLTRCLTSGKLIDVPAGCAGDRRFYVAAMAGSLADLARPREAIRKGKVLKAIETLAGSDILDLRTSMQFDATAPAGDGSKGFATAIALFVGDESSDTLEFAYIDPDNPLELAASGLGALFSDWHEAPGVTTLAARDVVINEEKGYELRVTLDGEPIRLPSGTRFGRIAKGGRAISASIE